MSDQRKRVGNDRGRILTGTLGAIRDKVAPTGTACDCTLCVHRIPSSCIKKVLPSADGEVEGS